MERLDVVSGGIQLCLEAREGAFRCVHCCPWSYQLDRPSAQLSAAQDHILQKWHHKIPHYLHESFSNLYELQSLHTFG